MQCIWPDGIAGSLHVIGTARDLYTGLISTKSIATERVEIVFSEQKRIDKIFGISLPFAHDAFAGLRPGTELKVAIANLFPGDVANSTLLYRILDELAGTCFRHVRCMTSPPQSGKADRRASRFVPFRFWGTP